MHFTLIVVGGVHRGRHIPVTAAEFLIGRGVECHLRPLREDVSRTHCALVQRDSRLFLRDCGSTNGTVLNRRFLVSEEIALAAGDQFEVGPLRFELAITAEPQVAAAEADDDSCFDANEIYSGLLNEPAPRLDDTVQVTRYNLSAMAPPKDEQEKML